MHTATFVEMKTAPKVDSIKTKELNPNLESGSTNQASGMEPVPMEFAGKFCIL